MYKLLTGLTLCFAIYLFRYFQTQPQSNTNPLPVHTSMPGQSALVLGATGATGKYLLKELLSSPHFNRVGECGRRVTPLEQITAGKEKLEQKTVDFEKIENAGLKSGKWDVVFITLGTSRKAAGSADAFEKIDREYVVNAARAAKTDDSNHSQRLVYLSVAGAKASSSFLYNKSKGLTELALAESGYNDTIIFRPAFLTGGDRANQGLIVDIALSITGILSRFSDNVEVARSELAKSMRIAGQLGSAAIPPVAKPFKEGLFTVIGNAGAIDLAKTGL